MNYYGIVIGYVSGGFGEAFVKTHSFHFASEEKRDAFYDKLGGKNGKGYGGMDITHQQNWGIKNNWGSISYADHMYKLNPSKPPELYDDYDLSKIRIGK